MGQARILIIRDESPTETVSAESAEREVSAPRNDAESVCEARIIGPGLILVDLTGATGHQGELWRRLSEVSPTSNQGDLRLSILKARDASGSDTPPIEEKRVQNADDSSQPRIAATPINVGAQAEQEPVLQVGGVRIDRHGHWAYLHDKKLHLTPTEFRLLECFLREPGRAFTRSQLVDISVSNSSFVLDRTIDVHIRSLRLKLGAAKKLIETVRGVGYRFRETPDLEDAD
jgi:DNA-binding winged helix-turn-helix (wHTH) protein